MLILRRLRIFFEVLWGSRTPHLVLLVQNQRADMATGAVSYGVMHLHGTTRGERSPLIPLSFVLKGFS
jgi:hypothetical protein